MFVFKGMMFMVCLMVRVFNDVCVAMVVLRLFLLMVSFDDVFVNDVICLMV